MSSANWFWLDTRSNLLWQGAKEQAQLRMIDDYDIERPTAPVVVEIAKVLNAGLKQRRDAAPKL